MSFSERPLSLVGSKGRGAMRCLPGADSEAAEPASGPPTFGFAIARPPASARATAPTINPEIASRLLTVIAASSGVDLHGRRPASTAPFSREQPAHGRVVPPARRQRGGPRAAPWPAPDGLHPARDGARFRRWPARTRPSRRDRTFRP